MLSFLSPIHFLGGFCFSCAFILSQIAPFPKQNSNKKHKSSRDVIKKYRYCSTMFLNNF